MAQWVTISSDEYESMKSTLEINMEQKKSKNGALGTKSRSVQDFMT